MSVATLNPFDLLNGDAPKSNKTASAPVASASVNANAKATTTTAKATTTNAKATQSTQSTAKTQRKPVAELNASLSLPTDGPKENTRRRGPRRDVPANERQAKRATDRHSRSGRAEGAGEKTMGAGKGNWGREGEVAESVEGEVVEAVESGEVAEESTIIEELPKRLTLAEYQASLKKPVVKASALRQVSSSVPAGAEVVKKPVESVYAPEIVKKAAVAAPAKKSTNAAAQKNNIDLSKYIAIKAVSSVEPRTERGERGERAQGDRRNGDRRSGDRDSTARNGDRTSNARNGDRTSNARTSTTSTSSAKVNLKDERSFPALGKN